MTRRAVRRVGIAVPDLAADGRRRRARRDQGARTASAGGSRAGPTRGAARSSSGATPTARRPASRPRASTSAPGSTSTAARAYLVEDDLVVVSDFATGRLNRVVAPGRARAAHAGAGVALRRHGPRPRPATGSSRSARTTSRRRSSATARPRTRSSRSTSRAARSRSSSRAPTSTRRRACRRTARGSPWLEWRHPNMPWDGTELRLAAVAADGSIGDAATVAGSQSDWISPAALVARRRPPLRRRAGRLDEPVPVRRRPRRGGHGPRGGVRRTPTGSSASRPTAFARRRVDRRRSARSRRSRPAVPRSGRSRRHPRDRGAVHRDELGRRRRRSRRAPGRGARQAGGDRRARPGDRRAGPTLRRRCRRRSIRGGRRDPAARRVPDDRRPDARTASSTRRRTARSRGPAGELPPLIVTSHGGPTAAAFTGLTVLAQLFTSRGFAVLDVDYGGSTGYGKAYRKRLEGQWGVVDLDDCVNGARWLAEQGLVDGERLAIRGGSASGYTTLCAVTFSDAFKAGTSYFGIGDLETFRAETHKFESRYDQTLVGPWPEAKQLYHDRSPINFVDRISCPVLDPPGRRGPGRAAGPGRADRRRALGEAPAPRVPAVPGRGPRLPRAPRTSSAASRPSSRSTARSSASRRPTRSSRSRSSSSTRPGQPRPEAWRPGDAAAPRHRDRRGRDRRRLPAAPTQAIAVVLILLVAATALAIARPPDRDPVPDPARPRRARARVRAGPAADRARARHRLPAVPAADPVRGGLLHVAPRLQAQPPGDHAAVGRARPVHDRRRRGRRRRRSCRAWAGRRRSRSARSSPRPTRSPRRRSSSGSACRAASSRSSRARAS